jgi:hypothetical protein
MFYALIDENNEYLLTGSCRVLVLHQGDNYTKFGLCKNVNEIADSYMRAEFIRVVIIPNYINIYMDDTEYVFIDEVILGEKYLLYDVKTIKKFNLIIDKEYITNVCLKGHLEILKYLYMKNDHSINDLICNLICNREVLICTFSDDYLKILEWWKSSGIPLKYDEDAINLASSFNRINVLNWWLKSGLPLKYDERAIDYSSMYGYVDVLEWWKNSGLPLKYSEDAINLASIYGNEDVLEWWKNSGLVLKYTEGSIDYACEYGSNYESLNGKIINILNWWFKSGLELKYSKKALQYASKGKNINILEWLKNSKLPF